MPTKLVYSPSQTWLAKLNGLVPSVSLAFFRISFGVLMAISLLRFVGKGWVADFYLKPRFYFPYYGFEWVKPLPAWAIYGLFILLILSAIGIALGLFYRLNMALFFLGFTYVELIDKTTYLNHYYFISLISLLMIFLPLHASYSLDCRHRPSVYRAEVPIWIVWALKVQISIVYFFGGISKIKPDWLLEAQPLRIWLSANTDLPIIGTMMDDVWLAYVLSWGSMLFDLSIPFLLSFRRIRPFGFLLVWVFHGFTHLFFYIGMFPWVMIVSTLLFLPAETHRKWLSWLGLSAKDAEQHAREELKPAIVRTGYLALGLFFLFQCLMPFRYLLYPGNLLWTEQGFRYGWNIMLMEKSAHLELYVRNPANGQETVVQPSDYLTRQQQRMVATQPDMILQYAHFVAKICREKGVANPEVRAECYASVNGQASRLLIDPTVDLTKEKESLMPKAWILP
jgi:hypothetical protein